MKRVGRALPPANPEPGRKCAEDDLGPFVLTVLDAYLDPSAFGNFAIRQLHNTVADNAFEFLSRKIAGWRRSQKCVSVKFQFCGCLGIGR